MRFYFFLSMLIFSCQTQSENSNSKTDQISTKNSEWVFYKGQEPSKNKHIVLVSGDEEYRSEEALPQLGKRLAEHHGFD